MQRATWWALVGAVGLLSMMVVLQAAVFPLAWIAPAATLALPSLCLFPALRCAVRRRCQLRQATALHMEEQKRLMLACRVIHARADALAEERRQLLEQIEAMQYLTQVRSYALHSAQPTDTEDAS